jgi:hypothetical protein
MLGKKSWMTAERVKLLEDAGFLFEISGSERARSRSSRSRRAAASLEEEKSDASEESEDEDDDHEVPMVAAARQAFGHQNDGYNAYRDQGYHTGHAYHHHYQQPHYPPPF